MNSALSQGLGYAMFIYLLFYVLKQQEKRDVKSEQREENYQKIISELSGKYSEIAKDVKEVKDYIFKKGDKWYDLWFIYFWGAWIIRGNW